MISNFEFQHCRGGIVAVVMAVSVAVGAEMGMAIGGGGGGGGGQWWPVVVPIIHN